MAKKRKKTAAVFQAEKDLEDTLRRVGYGRSDVKNFRYEFPDLKTSSNAELSNEVAGSGKAKKTSRYTGTEIMGIATMHKSNAVPIRRDSKESAKDIAKMRRP